MPGSVEMSKRRMESPSLNEYHFSSSNTESS
jgi:hypothetical protein